MLLTLEEKKSNQIKKNINNLKNELIKMYHIALFEGLDFRGEGLARIILNIWNLGVNIDMNYIPSYLDQKSVEFIFKKAKKIIDISKFKKKIEEYERDWVESLKKWKNEHNFSINSNQNNKKFFFKTKINEKNVDNNSFLEYYSLAKLFMNHYKKRNDNEFQDNEKYNKIILRNWDIPKIIIEKNQKIENAKLSLQVLEKQNDK